MQKEGDPSVADRAQIMTEKYGTEGDIEDFAAQIFTEPDRPTESDRTFVRLVVCSSI